MGLHFNFRQGLTWEKHNIDKMKLWGTGQDIGDPVHAGVFVSQESALRLAVVWRCIQLISGAIAGMPIDVVRKRGAIREPVDRPPTWVSTPNPETNSYEFRERVCESLLMDGNSFVLITARDALGFPAELWTLNPRRVQVRRRENSGRIYFLVDGETEYTRYGPDAPLGEVLHIRLPSAGGVRGMSPIEFARQAIGLGLVTEKYGARFFGQGSTPPGLILLPQAQSPALAREYAELTRETWQAAHAGPDKQHVPGILAGGAGWQNLQIPNDDAQFLDTRKFQVEDIAARIYGVPAHMVGLEEKNTSWGTGIEAQSIAFVRYTLMPHIVRLETAFSTLLPRGQFVKMNQRELLRADSKTEAEVLNSQLEHGVINPDEYRELMDRPPRPGGNRYILPLNMQILQSSGQAEPAPEPAPPPEPQPSNNGQASLFGGDENDKRIRELR